MSELISIRAITFPLIPVAALTVFFALLSGESTKPVDRREPLAPAFVPYLGEMTVVAPRIPEVQLGSNPEGATVLGAITITATRLPAATASSASAAPGDTGAPRLTKADTQTTGADSDTGMF